jgi:hypothetical protein
VAGVAVAAGVAVVAAVAEENLHMTSPHYSPRARIPAYMASALALVFCLAALPAAYANKAFQSPQAAMEAFGDAVATSDADALKEILGAKFRELIPPIGTEDRFRFLEAWARSHVIEGDDGKVARIAAGGDGWTLPIPLVKAAAGWQFDTAAGAEEMRVRRIGRNELAAQQTLLAIYDAQREYASQPRGSDGLLTYAKRLTSTPGQRDGLYWPTKAGEPPSLLGPTLAAAGPPSARPDGYHGYHYKLLSCSRRRARLCRERQAAGRIRHRGVARTVLGHGGDELHRQSLRTGLRT